MTTESGRVKIAPEVITTVTRRTVLAVPGVAALAPRTGNRQGFRLGQDDGIEIARTDDATTVTLAIIVEADVNITQVSRDVQQAVKRAIEEIVGLPVTAVNIHIEDVRFAVVGA